MLTRNDILSIPVAGNAFSDAALMAQLDAIITDPRQSMQDRIWGLHYLGSVVMGVDDEPADAAGVDEYTLLAGMEEGK